MEEAGENDPLALARMQILLPTRRACRSLREAFLRLHEGKPLLLPRMRPIGDIDEEELNFYIEENENTLSLPPSCPPMRRKFMLARLIAAQGHGRNIEQDLMLADALGHLMDQVYTENLDLGDLPKLVDNQDFAAHWQVSLNFLSLLSVHWPKILKEEGLMDAADRRNRLIHGLAAHWQKNPPATRIIAAGSTGSIPATAELLKTVAGLPNGCVVLPGLDQSLDETSWQKMDDTHPQATLKHLVEKVFEVDRQKDVQIWPSAQKEQEERQDIRRFVSEIMRPAETSQEWQTLSSRLSADVSAIKIERYDCANSQEEALVIALALRRTLEEKKKRGALVTPDRKLARRVATICHRWGIEIDDSGGETLGTTRVGTFLRLCLHAVCNQMKPVTLLSFCKHALCLPQNYKDWRSDIRRLDATIMRGPAFEGGMDAYDKRLKIWCEEHDGTGLGIPLAFLNQAFTPLLELAQKNIPVSAEEWCETHLKVCETFCRADILWTGQDGEEAALFFSRLQEEAQLLPPLTAQDYLLLIEQTMQGVTVRPAYGLHPRLMILGQLEARLVEADVMILSGLNESTWPPQPATDPWMSRPMRKKFGLPPLERSIGLSAHDFAQSLCAQHVILTRSERVDGTPTVPSRWLQRMDTVLQALDMNPNMFKEGPLLGIACHMDKADEVRSLERPCPTPPVSARPRELYATRIETWISDPYGIYARHILKLKKLPPLEQPLDAALRGTLIHTVLDRFVAEHPKDLRPGLEEDFIRIAREEMDELALEADIRTLWEPRIEKIAHWLIQKENKWREYYLPAGREIRGSMSFEGPAGTFTLSAIADRIDLSRDGTEAALIDYKSGGTFSQTGMVNGKYPQLPLEALILEAGGFSDLKPVNAAILSYWIVNGRGEGGKETTLQDPAKASVAKENARHGLQALIDAFDDPQTPYYSLPRPDRAPRFNDYEHLARVKEWTALDENEQEDAA